MVLVIQDGLQDYVYNHHPFDVVGWGWILFWGDI